MNTAAHLPIRVLFFGTPQFALPSLEALRTLKPDITLMGVITAPDKPKGRTRIVTPPPVKIWANAHRINVMQPKKLADPAFIDAIQQQKPDVGIIASYGKIIPKAALDVFPKGVLNVHPSLLPRWRGPSPIQAAILAGDTETGVTIMLTDEEMDHGPILSQETLALSDTETLQTLSKKLAVQGAALLAKILPLWLSGDITPRPQDHTKATFSTMVSRAQGRIDWGKSSSEIDKKIRAYTPWPGSFSLLPDRSRLKILFVAEHSGESSHTNPGTIAEDNAGFPIVRTHDGWLKLLSVQPEGKPSMSGDAFLRGHRNILEHVLQ